MRSIQRPLNRCRRLCFTNASQLAYRINHKRRPNGLRFAQARAFSSVSNQLKSDPSFFNTDVDTGLEQRGSSEDSLLDRARIHGIETLDRLAFEADLGIARKGGTRLLDDETVRQDLDLWAVLLDYRRIKNGHRGVRDVLSAMLHGGSQVRLHADSVSGHIWRVILPVVLAEEKLLYDLCQSGALFMSGRPRVFVDVVGQLLRQGNRRLAITFGTQFLAAHFRGRPDVLLLFEVILQLGTEDALRDFCQLTARLPLHKIYPDVVPRLWASGRKRHTFLLHRHLLSRGDRPTKFEQIEAFVVDIAANKHLKLEPFLHDLERHQVFYSHQARRLYQQERIRLDRRSRSSTNLDFHAGPGSRPVKLSDAFVARTFATRSVSFDFVLAGLRFVGLFEMGPVAVREMALGSPTVDDLEKRFRQLDQMEIDLGTSNYVHVLRNLCRSGQGVLLQAVLDSDMHHEVFEDVQKQKRLLTEYYRAQRWPEVDRTLAILNGGNIDREAMSRSARLTLQTALINGDWRAVLMALDNLQQALHQSLVQRSDLAPMRLAIKRIWSGVDVQTRTDTEYLDHCRYLIGFMRLAHAAGLQTKAWQWRSALHAVGHTEDWALFRHLIFCTARMFYGKTHETTFQPLQTDKNSLLNEMFNGNMQCFILEIGLTASAKDQDPQRLWCRGIRLLRSLAHTFQISVNHSTVSQAFKVRLQELFKGTEPGAQKRFVDLYLSCFDWAWSETSVDNTKGLSSISVQHEVTVPDATSLRLLQARSRLVRQRRHSNIPGLFTNLDEQLSDFDDVESLSPIDLKTGVPEPHTLGVDEAMEDEVFYEAILHPSYGKLRNVQKT